LSIEKPSSEATSSLNLTMNSPTTRGTLFASERGTIGVSATPSNAASADTNDRPPEIRIVTIIIFKFNLS